MAAKAAGVPPMTGLPMPGTAAETVTIPVAMHGEAMVMTVMMAVMMAVVMSGMRKAGSEIVPEKTMAKRSMTMAVTAAMRERIALRDRDEQKER